MQWMTEDVGASKKYVPIHSLTWKVERGGLCLAHVWAQDVKKKARFK